MAHQRQYSDTMLDSMQSAYGDGYLSPGGPAEVRAILGGLPLTGRDVLDLGCGVGGAAILMASQLGVASVTGVDLEAEALKRAANAIQAAGLTERIRLTLVEPGPLPLPDDSFDVVYNNDVICHVSDKPALFADLLRVLRPGGCVALGDWMTGAEGPGHARYDDWAGRLAAAGLNFFFEGVDAYIRALEDSGFIGVVARDSSAASQQCAREQLNHLLGPARQAAIDSLGEAAFDRRVALSRARLDALTAGALEHWHLRAYKP